MWAFFSLSSVESGGYSLLKCVVFLLQCLLLLQSSGPGSQRASVVVACVGLLGPLYVGILVPRSGMEPKSPALGRAKAKRVLSRERTGHRKHPFPTPLEVTLHIDITKCSILISD